MPKDYTRSPVDCRIMSNPGMEKRFVTINHK
jgi:hypothetical protein